MIHSLAENHTLKLKLHHMKEATKWVLDARRTFLAIVGEATATPQHQMQTRLVNVIKEHSPISLTNLQRKLQRKLNGAMIDYMLNELIALGRIKKDEKLSQGGQRWYKYIGTGRLYRTSDVDTTVLGADGEPLIELG
jgi:hypothetical protein